MPKYTAQLPTLPATLIREYRAEHPWCSAREARIDLDLDLSVRRIQEIAVQVGAPFASTYATETWQVRVPISAKEGLEKIKAETTASSLGAAVGVAVDRWIIAHSNPG